MNESDVFTAAEDERLALADLLESLSSAELATPSLCAGWDVKTVGAHLAVAADLPVLRFAGLTLRYGGRPHRANDALARQLGRRPLVVVVAALRAAAAHRVAPPGIGPLGPFTDVLVHAGDIRRPIGLPHEPAPERVAASLGFLTGWAPGFVPRHSLDGLRLRASDLDLTWGTGSEVTGRGVDLMMAVCGRQSVLVDLTGDGVDQLSAQLTRPRSRLKTR